MTEMWSILLKVLIETVRFALRIVPYLSKRGRTRLELAIAEKRWEENKREQLVIGGK